MTSTQHSYHVIDAGAVQTAFKKRIAHALEHGQSVSFLAVAPLHYVHEKLLGNLLRRVLANTNHRAGIDFIVREAEQYCYYVCLGADMAYTIDRAFEIQQECDAMKLRITGSAMYLPQHGTIDERAQEIYECLSTGVDDHRRKLPVVYPEEFTRLGSVRPSA